MIERARQMDQKLYEAHLIISHKVRLEKDFHRPNLVYPELNRAAVSEHIGMLDVLVLKVRIDFTKLPLNFTDLVFPVLHPTALLFFKRCDFHELFLKLGVFFRVRELVQILGLEVLVVDQDLAFEALLLLLALLVLLNFFLQVLALLVQVFFVLLRIFDFESRESHLVLLGK